MFLRFFFPRTLFEPSSRFRIGAPSDFPIGVDERFKQSHRIWVVRQPDKLFVIYGRCTHLGCTPNWVETENKFKCPCHGSGYDIEGGNFEGPRRVRWTGHTWNSMPKVKLSSIPADFTRVLLARRASLRPTRILT